MNAKKYKCASAELTIIGEDEVIEDWGINVEIDEEHIIFDQIVRKVSYEKNLVRDLKLHLWHGHFFK